MEQSRFESFALLTASSTKSLQRLKQMAMEQYGLSAAHTVCLCRLQESPCGLTQGELAEQLDMDRAQVSRVLRQLVERDYVRPSQGGAYRRRYSLTAEGVRVTDGINGQITRIYHYVVEGIPEEEREVFNRTLDAIAKRLNQAVDWYEQDRSAAQGEE